VGTANVKHITQQAAGDGIQKIKPRRDRRWDRRRPSLKVGSGGDLGPCCPKASVLAALAALDFQAVEKLATFRANPGANWGIPNLKEWL
jgi:hypothetical protein